MGTRKLRAIANALRGRDRSPGNVVVDCRHNGFGDAAVLAWLAEGTKHLPRRILPHATGAKKEFLELLGQEVVPATRMMYPLSVSFGWDVSTCCSQSRLRLWAKALGVEPQWRRPTICLTDRDVDDARHQIGHAHPVIVLCPMSSSVPRRWPLAYWQALYHHLQTQGMTVFVVAPHGEKVLDAPTLYGTWRETAAIMSQADAVVANDSGPMNLAGTLDVATVALLGPTTEGIAAHLQSVHCVAVTKRELECVGCWRRYGYDSSCDMGCTALSMLSVERVASAVASVLGQSSQPGQLITHYGGLKIRSGACGRRDAQIVHEQYGANVFRLAPSNAPARVLDVGAHIGAFAAHCRRLMPNAEMACIEPCGDNLECLKANVGEFAAIRQAALAYGPEPLALLHRTHEISSDTGGPCGTSPSAPVPPGFAADERPLARVTMEDIMQELGWETVDLLKLDCGGREHSILRQSPAIRRGQVRRIVGRYHDPNAWAETCQHLGDWSVDVYRGGDSGLFEARHVGHR